MRKALALAVFLSVFATSCSHVPVSEPGKPSARPRLVLISVDGMRPDFYSRAEYRALAPTLAKLSDESVKAPHGIHPVFPSVTYPNHIAMVTGAYSAEHGVYNNRVGTTEQWNWYESAVRLPTLWQAAQKAGLKVALIRWPASVGAKVSWQMPEIFAAPSHGFDADGDWEAIKENVDPEFLKQVLAHGSIQKPASIADLDQLDTQAVEYVLTEKNPDFVLLHLIDLDRTQHQVGTDSKEVDRALQRIDSELARVVKLIDPARTTLIVTGDHGFATYTRFVGVPALIQEAGLADQVEAATDGGQAAIYAKPVLGDMQVPKDPCRILAKAAEKYEPGLLMPISRAKLDNLHAYPGALCALESKLGVVLNHKQGTKVLETVDPPRGHHGWLPNRREMAAGFMIWGKGVSKPKTLAKDPQMPDIAPTAAAILGIPFDAPAGVRIGF